MNTKWSRTKLGNVLSLRKKFITIDDEAIYARPRVQLHAQGIVLRDRVPGALIKTKKQQVCQSGDFLVAEIDAKVGGYGIVPDDLNQSIVSSHYFLFEINAALLNRRFLDLFIRTPHFQEQVEAQGSTNYAAIRPSDVLSYEVPLPSIEEQEKVVSRIDKIQVRIIEATTLRRANIERVRKVLISAYHEISEDASIRPLGEIAPLTRRPATVESNATYPQVSTRSFGRGTFHKPPLRGDEITWQKPFLVKAGDILLSNIKAWEGAVAVARPEDDGRYGSHRYLTCVPVPGVASASYICFHLLTPAGLLDLGKASPGTADRNRTLNARALAQIQVPCPSYQRQAWFERLLSKVENLNQAESQMDRRLASVMPSLLSLEFAPLLDMQMSAL